MPTDNRDQIEFWAAGLAFVRDQNGFALCRNDREIARVGREHWISAAVHTWTDEDYRLFLSHWRAFRGSDEAFVP